jgi:hypothetical protein
MSEITKVNLLMIGLMAFTLLFVTFVFTMAQMAVT